MDGVEWDPVVRREQRRDLRDIIQEVQQHRDEVTLPDELVRRVKSMNKVYKDLVSTREAAIDAEGFQLLSAIGKEQAECTAGEMVFDQAIFAEKLVTFMGGRRGGSDTSRDLNWSKLGEKTVPCFRTVPHLTFLHGALDLAPIARKQRQRRTRQKDGPDAAVSKPKELTHFEDEEESTTKDVAHIFNYLRIACGQNKRVHYFRFLVDPNSFAHTVENLFHFAFLVKDGRAGIMVDSTDHQPYIHLPEARGKSVKPCKNQAILSFNKDQWEKAIEKFGIATAQIPPREN